jgi:Neurotransmitter-gated ion-channel ligand binding domain
MLNSDYNANLLPSGNSSQSLAVIRIGVTVYDVPNVDDVAGLTQVNLGLQAGWIDPRLNFLNLESNLELNVLSGTEYASIWAPTLRFQNKAPNFRELEEVKSPTITIIANVSALSPLSDMYTANVFPGSMNLLLWREQIR